MMTPTMIATLSTTPSWGIRPLPLLSLCVITFRSMKLKGARRAVPLQVLRSSIYDREIQIPPVPL